METVQGIDLYKDVFHVHFRFFSMVKEWVTDSLLAFQVV